MGISVDFTKEPLVRNTYGKLQSVNGENREEGEIVDEFEDIISSDEELTMRKRIEELEARNSELEKLANISGHYNFGCAEDRYKSGPTIISLSDSDDYSREPAKIYAKKRKQMTISTQRNAERYRIHRPVLYKTKPRVVEPLQPPEYFLRDHHKSRKRKNDKSIRNRNTRKKDRLKSRKRSRLDYASSSDEEVGSLDRDELRKALRHEPAIPKIQGNLVTATRKNSSACKEITASDDEVIEINGSYEKQAESDDSESLELQELRLIALKSAFLNKDRERKQRKQMEEKKPYSPTDCLQPIVCLDSEISSPKEFLDLIPTNSMDISPIASPDSLKPIDMDIVDSSNSSSVGFADVQPLWTPIPCIGEIPLPNNDRTTNAIISPIPIRISVPTPDSTHFRIAGASTRSVSGDDISIGTDEDEKVEIKSNENDSPEPLDEEVLALRTLLLAQKNSPKFGKDSKTVSKATEPGKNATTLGSDLAINPLQTIMNISQGPPDKTAEILKEAVKRLQSRSNQSDGLQSSDDLRIAHSTTKESTDTLFSNDVDYRLPNAFTKQEPLDSNVKRTSEQNVTKNSNCAPAHHMAPAKNAKIKENLFICGGTRPNNIEIIPTKIVQRSVWKSPLTEITETDNVALDRTENNAKPKNAEFVNKPESINDSSAHKAPIASSNDRIKACSTITPKTSTIAPKTDQMPQKLPPIPQTAAIPELKRQRKKSTTLEALQLKTQNLISNGKLISRNKIVATKLLNKAIHQNFSPIKKKLVVVKPNTESTSSGAGQTSKFSADARLIKIAEVPTVKPLVINISCKSESESDDYFDGDRAVIVENNVKISTHDIDTYDMASPMSLPMDSPRNSPLTVPAKITSISCSSISATGNLAQDKSGDDTNKCKAVEEKANADGTFEAKLEEFLKNARSEVDRRKKSDGQVVVQPPTLLEKSKSTTTPAAVRHLPISSQLEYRRLIDRMQMLERQKQAKSKTTITPKQKSIKVTIRNDCPTTKPATVPPISKVSTDENNALNSRPLHVPPSPIVCLQRTIHNDSTKIDKDLPSKENSTMNTENIAEPVATTTDKQETQILPSHQCTDIVLPHSKAKTSEPSPSTSESKPIETSAAAVDGNRKAVPVKRHFLAHSSSSSDGVKAKKSKMPTLHKIGNLESMEECEQEYRISSSDLLDNMAKTIMLVVNAQGVKRETQLLKEEMVELSKRMEDIGKRIDTNDSIIAKLLPKISSSYKNILTLKDRSEHLDQLSMELAKRLGDERNNFYTEQKNKIRQQRKELWLQIKTLKTSEDTPDRDDLMAGGDVDLKNSLKLSSVDEVKEKLDHHNQPKATKFEMDSDDKKADVSVETPRTNATIENSLICSTVHSNELNSSTSANLCEDDNEKPFDDPSVKLLDGFGNTVPSDSGTQNSIVSSDDTATDVAGEVEENTAVQREGEESDEQKMSEIENREEIEGSSRISNYISPLDFSENDGASINPNGIICPYQLMGLCVDKECKYEHLEVAQRQS